MNRQQQSGQRDFGATAVEYALLLALVFVVIVGAVTSLGLAVDPLFAAVLPGL